MCSCRKGLPEWVEAEAKKLHKLVLEQLIQDEKIKEMKDEDEK